VNSEIILLKINRLAQDGGNICWIFETNLFSPPKAGGKQSTPAYGGLKCMVLLHSTNIIAALRLEKSPNSR
jgi:hypothetical protein